MKMLTEAERKERAVIKSRKWRAENRDKHLNSVREYQKRNKEKINIRRKIYYQENKNLILSKFRSKRRDMVLWLREFKSSLECARCPETDIECLDFHHINPNEKEVRISTAIRHWHNKDRILKEISKCVVLCANCHRKEEKRLRDIREEIQ